MYLALSADPERLWAHERATAAGRKAVLLAASWRRPPRRRRGCRLRQRKRRGQDGPNASEAASCGGCKSRGFPVRPVNQRESSLRDASGLTFTEDSSRWRAIACRAAFSRLTISRFLAASSRLPTIRCALPR